MKRGYVTLDFGPSGKSRMAAVIFGEWAVHRCPYEPGFVVTTPAGWRITHAPSGLTLAELADQMTYRAACRAARRLAEFLPEVAPGNTTVDQGCVVQAILGDALHGDRR